MDNDGSHSLPSSSGNKPDWTSAFIVISREYVMKRLAVALVTIAFAAGAFGVTAEAKKAKDAPGKCGVMKYFDTKTKKCKSKG